MNPDELIQLMRTCSLAEVRAELGRLYGKKDITLYTVIETFYARVAQNQKKNNDKPSNPSR